MLFGQFGGGNGTSDDPWQIQTAEHLNNVRNYLGYANRDNYFKLMNDIDLSSYQSGAGWAPIGYYVNLFYGKFEGNNQKITGLRINRNDSDNNGLFGILGTGGEIKNLGVVDVIITGVDRCGGLVGGNEGIIKNCYATGSVTGNLMSEV